MVDDPSPVPSPAEISELQLPETAGELIREYNRRIGHRPEYLWRWLYAVFPRYRLSSVPDRFHGTVREQKLLLTIYYTLIDDLADYYEDRETFMEARKLPRAGIEVYYGRPDVDDDYLAFTETVWETVEAGLRTAARSAEFWPAFEFDCQQVLNAVHYGILVHEIPELATEFGTDAYNEHNMAQFSYADIDVMFSPAFDASELRPLREVVWRAQRLARISNWVATWEREIEEGDLTSGVVVRALADGIVSPEDLTDPDVSNEALIEHIRDCDIEREFLDEWDRLYDRLIDRTYEVESIDLRDYVTGMKEMRDLYQANRGRL